MRKLLTEKVKKIIAYIILGVFGISMLGIVSYGMGIGLTLGKFNFLETLLIGFGIILSMALVVTGVVWSINTLGGLD